MTNIANFELLEDRAYPLQTRLRSAQSGAHALAELFKIYLSANVITKGALGAEVLDVACLSARSNQRVLAVLGEVPIPEPGTPARSNYDAGFQRVRGGLAETVQGSLEMLAEPYAEVDRIRFAACLAEELPLLIPLLSQQGEAEARRSVTRMLKVVTSSGVARELHRLDAELKSPSSHPLAAARKAHSTRLTPSPLGKVPREPAPPRAFRDVEYPSAAGMLPAYLTPSPNDGRKLPAIIWLTGGDCNSIGDVWSAAPAANDQTAAAYRNAGVVMMFPSLRGGNDNPGTREGFLGEVDDVIAAHAYLSKVEYVDPSRIYLGGHSTGGTLALLVAEVFDGFKGVFSFGPVADVRGYGKESNLLPYDVSVFAESKVRSPGYWLGGIHTPTWIIEGVDEGNIESLRQMRATSKNPVITWAEIDGATHFTTLAPLNRCIASKLVATAPSRPLSLSAQELAAAFVAFAPKR